MHTFSFQCIVTQLNNFGCTGHYFTGHVIVARTGQIHAEVVDYLKKKKSPTYIACVSALYRTCIASSIQLNYARLSFLTRMM